MHPPTHPFIHPPTTHFSPIFHPSFTHILLSFFHPSPIHPFIHSSITHPILIYLPHYPSIHPLTHPPNDLSTYLPTTHLPPISFPPSFPHQALNLSSRAHMHSASMTVPDWWAGNHVVLSCYATNKIGLKTYNMSRNQTISVIGGCPNVCLLAPLNICVCECLPDCPSKYLCL